MSLPGRASGWRAQLIEVKHQSLTSIDDGPTPAELRYRNPITTASHSRGLGRTTRHSGQQNAEHRPPQAGNLRPPTNLLAITSHAP